ncbi:MAG TPA: hypothetical protein VNX21_06930 [Candidatus Thermoplasmatota archaeon]|nr:hypothetical protein [Candidatus Thermoplasmatota archaeon]
MNRIAIATAAVLVLSLAPSLTLAHGWCAHEAVHTYGVLVGHDARSNSGVIASDSESTDCNPTDGVPFDFDGDLDWGVGGGAFGHGPWATWCGYHQEVAGTVTVTDLVWGKTVGFATGSSDAYSWVPDPVTGANTCITDGIISPGSDDDDCLSASGTGTQGVVCPGGGDGLLWVLLYVVDCSLWISPPTLACSSPPTVGTITSP